MPRKKKEETEETAKKTAEESEKEDKLAKLKEKAKKLAEAVETKEIDIKKVKGEEEKADMLVPIEDYLKSSIHLGTRAITPDMKPYVYKRRADSLAVFNTTLLDEKIKEGAEYLSKFPPSEIIVVCKRESGHKAAELFSKVTGIRTFTKKYPAGILTNPNLDTFIEAELMLICDPWTDKNALLDAKRVKIPVMSICDTNNYTQGVDRVIPGNNKSAKSLGMIFYLFAKIYIEKRKIKADLPPIQEFIDGWDTLVPPK
jgi:small subunit ribosomal protein S2